MDRERVEYRVLADLGSFPVVTVQARHPDFPDLIGSDSVSGDRFGSIGADLDIAMMRERAFLDLQRQVRRALTPARGPQLRRVLLAGAIATALVALLACHSVFEVKGWPYCPAPGSTVERDSIPLGCGLDSLPRP